MLILLYTATIIRGDLSIFKSPVKVVLMILNLLFIASFTKTMINTNEWKVQTDRLNLKPYISFTESEIGIPKIFICIYLIILFLEIMQYVISLF